jgi:hypothetical protein
MHPRSGAWRSIASFAAILACTAAIAWTSLGGWKLPQIGPKQPDYFNLLVDGFRKGSLALDIAVPEELRNTDNLQGPGKRPPGVPLPHDVSFKGGHYYLYFGAVPAVVLFWPFQALTAHDLPLVLGSLGLEFGALLVAALLWLKIVRDQFPRSGTMTRVVGIAALALAGGQWALARRIAIWEPSIISGYFFLTCMLASGYLALCSRRPWPWLAAAGLSLGLAIGSRPNLAVAAAGIGCLLAAIGLREPAPAGRTRIRALATAGLSVGLPLAAVVACLLAYNWSRFGSPFEFGLNYQLTDAGNSEHFSLSYIPYNFYAYFWSAPQWGRYFPFLHPIAFRAPPPGYFRTEFVYGALTICPVIWWALPAPAFARRASGELRWLVATVACIALATTVMLLCFDTATARYEADFLPWWVWLGMLAWGLVEDRLAGLGRPGLLRVLRLAFAVSVAFSCAAAFLVSAQLYGILEAQNPTAYRGISRLFNTPLALVERMTGYKGGAVTMDIRFARHPNGSYEPLLVTGVGDQKDYVYLYYQSGGVARFCYQHPGEPPASGIDVPFEPGHSYPVRIEIPSLYPPEGFPSYDGLEPAEVATLKNWVRVEFDGKTVLDDARQSYESSPGTIRIGRDEGGACGTLFSGEISNVQRVGWSRPEEDLAQDGDYAISLVLPSLPLAGIQPVISAGESGRADLLGIAMEGSGHYQFAYESWGEGAVRSPPLDIPRDRLISLRVRFGPALWIAGDSPLGVLGRSVVVWEDGTPVFWNHTGYALPPKPRLRLMSNEIGSSMMANEFRARFVSASRLPAAFAWHTGPFSALELDALGRGSGVEPLLATGATGTGDMLAIEWLGPGKARIKYDHWGEALRSGPVFNWSDSSVHRIRMEMPSAASLDAQRKGAVGEGPLRVGVDGRAVWEETVPFYHAAPDSVSVGRNSSGFSTAGRELRCAVIDLRQEMPGSTKDR